MGHTEVWIPSCTVGDGRHSEDCVRYQRMLRSSPIDCEAPKVRKNVFRKVSERAADLQS
jgi:hypothetical protein